MNTKYTCPKCSTPMREAVISKEYPIAGVAFAVTMPGHVCPVDDSWIVSNEVSQEIDRKAVRAIATHGPATGRTLKYLHAFLQLKGTELAALIGVQPETLSRWESEAQPLAQLAWVTVAAMVLDKLEGRATTTKQLRAAATGELAARPIVIDVRP
jgi:hypothetical protein